MKKFLFLVLIIFSSQSFATSYTFECQSRGVMKLDLDKNTFEWGRFGEVPTEFNVTEDSVELLKPFGKKYYFNMRIFKE